MTTQAPILPPFEATPPRADETTGSAERVDPADVLEELDADGSIDPDSGDEVDVDVDLSDFAPENDVPTSVGNPDDPLPDKKRVSLRQRLSGKR